MLPLIALIVAAAAAGLAAWFLSRAALRRWWGREPGRAVTRPLREHAGVRRHVDSRLDAEALTGLALTLALATIVVAGVLIATLVILLHHSDTLLDVDSAVARWGADHRSDMGHRALEAISFLASTPGVIAIGIVVGALEWRRLPNRWIPAFLLVVAIGDSAITNAVKQLVDRARPTIDPLAASLGPSFPSGHSSTAAAFFAALALLAGRRRSDAAKAALIAVAVGFAVAVASSRVLLDLHWTSDVVAGLALGWAWFSACAVAFGGWLLRLGAPVEAATRPATAAEPAARRGSDSLS